MDMRPIDLASATPLAPPGLVTATASLLLVLLAVPVLAARLLGQLLLRDLAAVSAAFRAVAEEVASAQRRR